MVLYVILSALGVPENIAVVIDLEGMPSERQDHVQMRAQSRDPIRTLLVIGFEKVVVRVRLADGNSGVHDDGSQTNTAVPVHRPVNVPSEYERAEEHGDAYEPGPRAS
jgi:hypothetical protein